jgi:hypothetical protein
MMLDWNEYRKQLAVGVKEFGQLSPDTIRGINLSIAVGTAGANDVEPTSAILTADVLKGIAQVETELDRVEAEMITRLGCAAGQSSPANRAPRQKS